MGSPLREATRARTGTPASKGARPAPVLWLIVLAVALLFSAPFLYLALGAISSGSLVWETVTSGDILRPLANSLLLGGSVALATMALGTALAVLVGRSDLRFRGFWRVSLALPLVMPSFVGATALIAATGRGGLLPFVPRPDGFWGSFLVLVVFTYPYVFLPVLAKVVRAPASAEEASRLLGRGALPTTLRVLLPQLWPAITAGGLLVFLYCLSEFGAVALLRFDTLTRVIYSSRLLDRELSLVLGLILAVIALAVSVLMRGGGESYQASVSRGGSRTTIRLRGWQPLALSLCAVPLVIGVVSPLAVFLTWMFRGSATVGVGYSGWGDDLSFLVAPVAGSTVAAVTAAVVAVLITLPVAFAQVRRPSRWFDLASGVVTSVFAIPGLVVALALVAWAVSAPEVFAPLYQSFPLLILGYVLHFGAQSLRATAAALTGVPPRFDEAAATLGANPRRRLVTVDLPMILPGLLAAGGLVLLSTIKELPATLLLAPTGFETLATTIWGAATDGFYAEVGAASLVLVALSAFLTWLLVLRGQARHHE